MILDAIYLRCDAGGCQEKVLVAAESAYTLKYGRVIRRIYAPPGWQVQRDDAATTPDAGEAWRVHCPGHGSDPHIDG